MNRDIFEDLFVLEMTNNHLGKLERGIEIIRRHAKIAKYASNDELKALIYQRGL